MSESAPPPVTTRTCRVCGQTYPATTEYFVGNKLSLYGVDRICRECKRAAHRKYRAENPDKIREQRQKDKNQKRQKRRENPEKERQYRAENADKIRGYRKKHYEANREKLLEKYRHYYYENHDKEIERMRQYREEHRAVKREMERQRYHKLSDEERARRLTLKREWQARNKNRLRQQARLWRAENPARNAATQHRWRARRRGLPDTLTGAEWQAALNYFGGRCAYCNREGDLSQDHFIALSDPECPGTVGWNILPACLSCNSSKKNLPPKQWLRCKFGKQAEEIEQRIRAYFERIERQWKTK